MKRAFKLIFKNGETVTTQMMWLQVPPLVIVYQDTAFKLHATYREPWEYREVNTLFLLPKKSHIKKLGEGSYTSPKYYAVMAGMEIGEQRIIPADLQPKMTGIYMAAYRRGMKVTVNRLGNGSIKVTRKS